MDQAALTAARVRRLDAEAPAQIRRALEPFGYYRARVHSTLERTGGGWRARYVIDPGPPLPVGRVPGHA